MALVEAVLASLVFPSCSVLMLLIMPSPIAMSARGWTEESPFREMEAMVVVAQMRIIMMNGIFMLCLWKSWWF